MEKGKKKKREKGDKQQERQIDKLVDGDARGRVL